MKYLALFIAAVICIFGLNILIPEPDITKLPELKISAYVFENETLVDPNERTRDEIYCFKELEVGKPLLLAPIIGAGSYNLSFYFEFDGGLVEMTSPDEDVVLAISEVEDYWKEENRLHEYIFDYRHRVASGGYICASPIGSGLGQSRDNDMLEGVQTKGFGRTGREYYLNVSALEFSDDSSPVISATIKLTQLEDYDGNQGQTGSSAYYSVELVSYQYGDKYQMILDSLK